jgi:hypothetical protein
MRIRSTMVSQQPCTNSLPMYIQTLCDIKSDTRYTKADFFVFCSSVGCFWINRHKQLCNTAADLYRRTVYIPAYADPLNNYQICFSKCVCGVRHRHILFLLFISFFFAHSSFVVLRGETSKLLPLQKKLISCVVMLDPFQTSAAVTCYECMDGDRLLRKELNFFLFFFLLFYVLLQVSAFSFFLRVKRALSLAPYHKIN